MTFVRSVALTLILAASPALAQELVVTNPAAKAAPKTTTTPPAAVSLGRDAERAVSAPDPTDDADIVPKGAPSDDYEFVGWCQGILSGHMELFGRVKPELDAISKRWNTLEQDEKDYVEQRAAGVKAQALFSRAMRVAEQAAPREIKPQGQIAISNGVAMWSQINNVDKQSQAYSWLNWGLPARCETIATQLEKRSTLAAAVMRKPTGAAQTATPKAPALPTGRVAAPPKALGAE